VPSSMVGDSFGSPMILAILILTARGGNLAR
jgi:hypothetical protein